MSTLIHRKTPFLPWAAAVSLTGATICLAALAALHLALGPLHNIDVALQLRIHAWNTPWLDSLMLTLTRIGSIKIFLSALAAVLLGMLVRGRRHAAAVLAYAITGALILNESLKLLFHRPRPTVPWSIHDERTFSFPSGHSFFSVVLYGTLCVLALRRGTPWWQVVPVAIVLPLAIGTSRIYLGEHYPTDVLAGWLCGTLWLTTVAIVDARYVKQRSIPPPPAA